jgi:CRISPR system Cascade subunit CasB
MTQPPEPLSGGEIKNNEDPKTPPDSEKQPPSPTEASDEGREETRSSLSSIVWSIAGAMQSKAIGTGDMAELRRLHAQDPGNPAFWKIAAHYLEPQGYLRGDGPRRDETERRWAAILNFMAHLSLFLRPGSRFGGALAEAGLSELRFIRLLRAQDQSLLDEVRTLARFLSSKGQPVDPTDLARLVLSDGAPHEESVRRKVARDFYSRADI